MPRAKTAEQKQRAGTWRADAPGRTARTRGDGPTMPRGLGKNRHAKYLWHLVNRHMGHILGPADAPTLALACQHYAIAQMAYDELMDVGLVTEEKAHAGNLRRHPMLTVWNQNSKACADILKGFAGTPAARAALPGADGTGRDDDWLAGLFEGL